MNIEIIDKRMKWGALDVNLFGVEKEWGGAKLASPLAFSLAVDKEYLWFIVAHQKAAMIHPQARPGAFLPELWKYDVAEFFLLDTKTDKYLEFNLAPNGAWWSAVFTSPRVRESEEEVQIPDVASYADLSPDGSWLTAAAVPLYYLRDEFGFGEESMMNVSFIINSPEQKFVSAADLGTGEPNFHQPDKFKKVNFFQLTEYGGVNDG